MPDEVITVPSESGQEIKLHAEATQALVKATPLTVEEVPLPLAKDVVVVASNPEQMQKAQNGLVMHFVGRLNDLEKEIEDAKSNVDNAKKNRWKAEPFKKVLKKLEDKWEFYQKIKCVLEAGYVMIPNFDDLDVFAIRTTKKAPKHKEAKGYPSTHKHATKVDRPDRQESNTPPAGEGQYVNSDTINWETTRDITPSGASERIYQRVSQSFKFDVVDFPFHLAKPQILDSTAKAMKLLYFDDVGVRPGRHIRRGDPMVVGRISIGRGYQQKHVSFLITWFVDTKDL